MLSGPITTDNRETGTLRPDGLKGAAGGRWTAAFSTRWILVLLAVGDLLSVLVPVGVLYFFVVGWRADGVWATGGYQFYLIAGLLWAACTIAGIYAAGLYRFEALSNSYRQIKLIIGISVLVFLFLVTISFGLKVSANYSRIWAFSTGISVLILIVLFRLTVLWLVGVWARAGRLTRNIAIFGAGEQGRRLMEGLEIPGEPWNRVVGVFDDRKSRIDPVVAGYPVAGGLDDLVELVRKVRVDDVLITLPWHADRRILDVIGRLTELPVHIHLGPDLVGFHYPLQHYSHVGGAPLLGIASNPLSGFRVVTKQIEDKILAALLLLFCAPLMLGCAIAIKLDSAGPVLFRQPRYGFNNKRFDVLKFRTMFHTAEAESRVPQATRNDPRVTRFGRFLRRSSLDELPQLFNVLGGSMSLVGPRPHAVIHNEEFAKVITGYFSRHRMKPGITGWAQVNGLRGETDTLEKMKARFDYDIYYIENWSIFFDLQILLRTVLVAIHQRNAY